MNNFLSVKTKICIKIQYVILLKDYLTVYDFLYNLIKVLIVKLFFVIWQLFNDFLIKILDGGVL